MSLDLVLMNFIINSIVTSSLVVVVHRTLEIAKKTNFNISSLQIGAKLYHKLGNFLLQIGASVFTNWGSLIITNQGSYCKLEQPLLQTGAAITSWGKLYYCKLGQLLQIGAIITNWGITVKTPLFIFCTKTNKITCFIFSNDLHFSFKPAFLSKFMASLLLITNIIWGYSSPWIFKITVF